MEVLISTVLKLLQVIINNLVPFPSFFSKSKLCQATVNRAWPLNHSLSTKVNSDPGWLKIDKKIELYCEKSKNLQSCFLELTNLISRL
jgi:hypothetical protein